MEESWKVKNAHLVHVLPLGWRTDSGAESDGASSSLSTLAGPSRSAGYIKTPARERTVGTYKPQLIQSIEQFLLSFAYPLGSLGHFGSGLNSGSGAGLSSPSLNLKQRPKSALVPSSASKEPRASTLPTPSPSMSNLTNINTPLKPVPYLLAPGVFASCAGRSNVRSRCLLPEDDLGQNHDQDTRGDAYMDTHTDPETTALTIGEIILLGALDFDHTRPGTGPGNGRAWIGDVGDVVVAGGSPDSGLSSRKVGIRKGKGREVAVQVVNTVADSESEEMKTTKRNFNGLLTPPESLSSNNSAESEEEEINTTEHTQKYARPIPPSPAALSTYSPPTHLPVDDHGNRNSILNTRSKFAKRTSPPSSISTPPSTPASTILKSKQTNNTSDKVKDKNSNEFSDSISRPSPLPLPSAQPPPLVVHCDGACSPRESRDGYDLEFGHEVPSVPPMTSMTHGSRSASGSGSASTIPLLTQRDEKTRSPKKESERKGFIVSTLRKIGLWNKW